MKKIIVVLGMIASVNAFAFGLGLGDGSEQMDTLLTVINNKGLPCEKVTAVVPGFSDMSVTCDESVNYSVKESDGDYVVKIK